MNIQAPFYAFPLVIICVFSTTFNCSKDNQCSHQNLACDDGEDCYIYCTGLESCQYTTFKCAMSTSVSVNVSCNVVCGDGTENSAPTYMCERTNVNAHYSDLLSLSMNGSDESGTQNQLMNVTCPYEGKCDIECGSGDWGCVDMTVNVQKSELNMMGTGDYAFHSLAVRGEDALKLTIIGNGSQTFYYSDIYCPHTEEGGPIKCNLKYTGYDRGFTGTHIRAIGSFSDISMICDSFSEPSDCYDDLYQIPRMYCLSYPLWWCSMTTDDGINWSCRDNTSVCNVKYPTLSPTHSPTASPTSITLTNIILITLLAVFALFIISWTLLYWSRKRKQNKRKLAKNKANYYHSMEIVGVKGKHDIFVEKKTENENDSLSSIGPQSQE